MALVFSCYAAMCLFDVVLEGIIWLPLGVFEYPGGHWAIFPNSYHPYPLEEMFTIASVFTAISCLRYFTNDKGQMFIERGVDKVKGTNAKRNFLRALAGIGAMQLIMFCGYNVTNGIMAANVHSVAEGRPAAFVLHKRHLRRRNRPLLPGPRRRHDARRRGVHQHPRRRHHGPGGSKHLPPVYPFLKQG